MTNNPFDEHIQPGDEVITHEDGSRFNKSQLLRLCKPRKVPKRKLNKMIKEVKIYQCEFDKVPTDSDLEECISIAKEHKCIVQLEWCLKWAGHYHIQIDENTTLEEAKNKLPKEYGV